MYNNINRLITSSNEKDDNIIGILYFLSALRKVSEQCNKMYNWLDLVI